MKKNCLSFFLVLCVMFVAMSAEAQQIARDSTKVPVVSAKPGGVPFSNLPADSTKPKKKGPDYSHLSKVASSHTGIFGNIVTVGLTKEAQMYPKAGLFGDSSHYLNTGAKFELLNVTLPLKKNQEFILINVVNNPPLNQFVGDTGWVLIQRTTLYKYLDHEKNMVDTNYLFTKYLNAAAKAREDAGKTKCPDNKKCYLQWAVYYDCMSKENRFGHEPAKCTLADCILTDCAEDNKK